MCIVFCNTSHYFVTFVHMGILWEGIRFDWVGSNGCGMYLHCLHVICDTSLYDGFLRNVTPSYKGDL